MRSRLLSLLAVATLVAACSTGDGDTEAGPGSTTTAEPTTTSGGAPTSSTTSTTGPDPVEVVAVDVTRPSDPRELGPGSVAGAPTMVRGLYVLAPDPSSDLLGCEGVPAPFLWIDRLDGSGREYAAPAEVQPLSGEVHVNADGRALVVVQCEGFLSDVWVSPESATGLLSDPERRPGLTDDGDLASFLLRWDSAPGSLLGVETGEDYLQGRTVVAIDVEGGARVSLHTGESVSDLAALADGRVVLVDGDRALVVDRAGGEPTEIGPAQAVAVAPDGRTVALAGQDGVLVGDVDGVLRPVAGTRAAAPVFSPDGGALSFTEEVDNGGLQVVVGLATDERVDLGPGSFLPAAWLADGTGLAFTRFDPDATGEDDDPFDRVLLVEFPRASSRS